MKNFYLWTLLIMLSVVGCQADLVEEETKNTYPKTDYILYLKTKLNNPRIVFLDSKTNNKSNEYFLEKVKQSGEKTVYQTYADTDKYDRFLLVYDFVTKKNTISMDSKIFALNKLINAYDIIKADTAMPYVYKDDIVITPTYQTVSLTYDQTTDTKKKIFIWTPNSYNSEDTQTKYSVIYMTDGQNLFNDNSTSCGSWGVAQAVTAMMSNSDNKSIVVGVDDSDGNRDSELTPNIGKNISGDHAFDNGTGIKFAKFVIETVMPYINDNYNVYTDAVHTSVCGSSSGGLEAFYIGMAYASKFGTIGALSPAFLIFGDDDWQKFLDTVDLSTNVPFVYIYNGYGDDLEKQLHVDAFAMYNRLKARNYCQDKLIWMEYSEAGHNEVWWRAIFPDFLKYAFK